MSEDFLNTIRQQLLNGDNSCLSVLFRDHSSFCIENLVRKYNCPREDAEDIFVDVIMSFRDRVISGKLQQLTNVRNYIFTSCRNTWNSRIQKEISVEKKHLTISREGQEETTIDPLAQVELDLEQTVLIRETRKAFDLLSEKCQDIINYVYIENYPMKEIAKLTGLANAEAVRVTKFRCMKKFVSLVKKHLNTQSDE